MSNGARTVNKLPQPTFRWLGMNGALLQEEASPRHEEIKVKASDNAVKVMEFKEDTPGLMEQVTDVKVEKGASLHLVQVQRLGEKTEFSNQVNVHFGAGANFDFTRLIVSGAKTWDSLDVKLAGTGSYLNVDLGYLLKGTEELDVNYLASHTGKKTESVINVSGVLRDESKKIFRGTIDFIRGCSGAVGNELEDVLMMDKTVKNKTIPLILCAEEDVVGNHGATIGRLPEELVFYMGTRGFSQEQIYETMAAAKVGKVIRLIPDGDLKKELLADTYGEEG